MTKEPDYQDVCISYIGYKRNRGNCQGHHTWKIADRKWSTIQECLDEIKKKYSFDFVILTNIIDLDKE